MKKEVSFSVYHNEGHKYIAFTNLESHFYVMLFVVKDRIVLLILYFPFIGLLVN